MFKYIYKLSRKIPGVSRIMRFLYSCDIPRKAKIGNNCRFEHSGLGTVVHVRAEIGDDCIIQHHVTIGLGKGGVPKIGNNVFCGPYSVILGDVSIGDNCLIGTNSYIVHDIPENSVCYNRCGELIIKTKEEWSKGKDN
ncbi:MAG: DapH/DapD/GlmU-related protein [Oscillospiraceae bacterium]|nr:DapH/DapD/GlmU-related protein [Oscillospiraceae bacterium]